MKTQRLLTSSTSAASSLSLKYSTYSSPPRQRRVKSKEAMRASVPIALVAAKDHPISISAREQALSVPHMKNPVRISSQS